MPPRLIVIAEGLPRAQIEPVIDDLVSKKIFKNVTYGSTADDFSEAMSSGDETVAALASPLSGVVLADLFEKSTTADGRKECNIVLAHSLSTGIDGHDVGKLKECLLQPTRKIPLSNARGVFKQMLAEHVILSVLYFTRQVPLLLQNRKQRVWDRFPSQSTKNMVLAVVGFGDIGRHCAMRAAAGLGMSVIGVRSGRSAPHKEQENEKKALSSSSSEQQNLLATQTTCAESVATVVFGDAGLEFALSKADVVLAILPKTDDTIGVFNTRRFSMMKKGAIFINIGRGVTVVDEDLVAALGGVAVAEQAQQGEEGDDDAKDSESRPRQQQHLRGAALDVFHPEPLPKDHPFWQLDDTRLLLTPHNADVNDTLFTDAAEHFADVATKFVTEKKLPEYLVDLADKGY